MMVSDMVSVHVIGTPRPAGGLRIGRKKNGDRFLAPNSSANLGKWKKAIIAALEEAYDAEPVADPINVELDFYVARPKHHYSAKGLRSDAPAYPTARASTNGGGDFDKLTRAVCDCMTGIVIADDSQIVRAKIAKRYADEREAGVTISIGRIDDECDIQYALTGTSA